MNKSSGILHWKIIDKFIIITNIEWFVCIVLLYCIVIEKKEAHICNNGSNIILYKRFPIYTNDKQPVCYFTTSNNTKLFSTTALD